MNKTKKSSKKKQQFQPRKLILPLLSLLIVMMVAVLVLTYVIPTTNNRARYNEIVGVYDSLNIGQEYIPQHQEVFGEKRVYSWDSGRTFSSAKYYTRAANVDVTVADLDAKIKAAGFEFFDEPYKGSVQIQYHYKKDGTYIRLSVSSKLRDDAFFNTFHMKGDLATLDTIDPNAGPSDVTIKVNLDDNNE